MKQKQIGKNLYVLTTEPYVISDVGDASVIFVHTNFYDEFKVLNPSLELTRYNYMLLRKSEPEYYKYINEPDFVDFEFDSSIQNVSSWIDETKSMILQSLHLPDDYTGTVSYTLNGNVLDSSAFTLENAGTYQIDASIPGTSLYEADTASYSIIYEKFKRIATLSFANAQVSVSTYVDSSYSGTIQQVQNAPENVDIKYYLNNSLLDSSVINLTEQGQYQVKAAIVSDEVYNDTSTSYTINYSKVKRDITLTFPTASVDVSTYVDENFGCHIDEVTNAPAGVDIHYYLNDVEIIAGESDGGYEIHLLNAGTYEIKARIINDNVYNDTSTTYTINYTKVKRDAVLSFADSSVNITVEDETSYSGNVQAVSGLPTGQTVNYYLDSSLLSGNTISIDDLVEGENSYTVTAKLEDSSIYNNTQASYTLNITCICAQYQKYEIFNQSKYFLASGGYSQDFLVYFDPIYYINDQNKDKWGYDNSISRRQFGDFSNVSIYDSYFNTIKVKLKDNSQSVLQTYRLGQVLPGRDGTDVIDIPETVQTMDNFNSTNNNAIKKLIIRSPYLYTGNAPSNVSSNIKIYVPEDSLQNYKTANQWKNISTNIYGSDFSKDFLTIRFINDTVDVSTYTTQNYSGTLQDYYGIPNDVPVKLYLDSSLLNSSSYTLTTTGNHTVLAEITNNSSYFDTSTTYTINYQRVKQDASIRNIAFSSQSGQTFDVDEQVSIPTVTYTTYPVSAESSVQVTYSFDGNNYVSQIQSQYLDTTTTGNYTYYVKFKIPTSDLTYNSQEFVKTWEWTVASAEPVDPTELPTVAVWYNNSGASDAGDVDIFNAGGDSGGGLSIWPTSMFVSGAEEEETATATYYLEPGEYEIDYRFANGVIAAGFMMNCGPGEFDYTFSAEIMGITSIGGSAFEGSNIEQVGIDDSVTYIGQNAFRNCTHLEWVRVDATTPPTLGSQVFDNISQNATIEVPAESVNAYKSASGWSNYASIIVAQE